MNPILTVTLIDGTVYNANGIVYGKGPDGTSWIVSFVNTPDGRLITAGAGSVQSIQWAYGND